MLMTDAQIHAYAGRPEPESAELQPPGTHRASFPIDSYAEPYPFGDRYAGIKSIFEAFGAQRMLWGSDLSGLSCSYREWAE